MKRNTMLIRTGLIGLMTWQLSACGDLVIKVQKKPRGSGDSALQSADNERNDSAIESAEDYLKDMDNLRAVAVDLLLKQLKGEDFRLVLRRSVRNYRSFLIAQSQKPIDGTLLDMSALKCEDGKLDLNMAEANKFLGVILKSAVLAKLSDTSAAALNGKLATEAAAISQLVLKEIGLKVEGDSEVKKDDDYTVTTGSFKISLVPFEQDDAETQAKDKSETINLAFSRKAGEKRTGEFKATISVSQLVGENQVQTHELRLVAERSLDGALSTHKASMALGKAGETAHYARSTTFTETEPKIVRIVDTISQNGQETKTTASIVDLKELGKCQAKSDETTDKDKDKGLDDVQTISPVTTVAQPSPEEETPVLEDEEPVLPVGKPGQNPNQSPSQSK